MKLLGILVTIVLVTASLPAHADNEFRMPLCPIVTTDGTQALEFAYYNGECTGKPKRLVRVTDFHLKVMWSEIVFSCIHTSEMDKEQLDHYNKLEAQVTSIRGLKFYRHAQTDGKTYRIEMLSGTMHSYTPAKHAVRSFDFVLKKACVMDGDKLLGCTPLTDTMMAQK